MNSEEQPQFVNFNGDFYPVTDPVITVQNRALRYGDALFETIRIIDGIPCFINDHVERLVQGCHVLRMNLPEDFGVDFVADVILQLAQKNGVTKGGRVRLSIMRNAGGFYTPDSNDISYLLEIAPVEAEGYELNKKGLSIGIYDDHRKAIRQLSSLKSANCLIYVLAGIYKTENNWDRVILLNELGNIAEEISSNIFLTFNGVIYTPSLNQGCLPGIMRKQIIDIALEEKIGVQEYALSPEMLFKADGVFLTNSIQGIRWVNAFRHKRYLNKMALLLNNKLNEKIKLLREEELEDKGLSA